MNTVITIRGMGGGINYEMLLIEKALLAVGFDVIVKNDAADWSVSNEAGWFDFKSNNVIKYKEKIELVADHIPWGG